MDILKKIISDKFVEIDRQKSLIDIAELQSTAADRSPPPTLSSAIKSARIGLIAEVKRRSPSAGTIRSPFEPTAIARAYEIAGAQAVSVLVDEKYFGGGEDVFREVRAATRLPMLYKEFVVDEWQIWHAAALGASAVLLIAAALEKDRLQALKAASADAGLEVLFEVHNQSEMDVALELGCPIIGINNRDLKTFNVSLDTTLELQSFAPDDSLIISESGIKSNSDVRMLAQAGIDGILVGQQLLEDGKDPEREIRELMDLSDIA